MSDDYWKRLTRRSEICTAQFPAEPGQDSTSRQNRFFESQSTTHSYRETHYEGRKSYAHQTWERQGDEPEQKVLDEEIIPWFPLEITQPTATQNSVSSFSKQDLGEWIAPLQEILVRACEKEDFFLQSEFLRLEKEERLYQDSLGRELVDLTWHATVDLMILPRSSPETHPVTTEFRFSEFVPDVLGALVRERGRRALQFMSAKPWSNKRPEAVYLRGHLVGELVGLLVRRLSGLSLYAGLSREKLGQHLLGVLPQGDTITLQALPQLYNSPNTNFFDDQGLIFSRRTLVEDGIVRSFMTSQETAHYLGLPLTGLNGNFSLAPGTLTRQDLTTQPALEILKWRTFEVEEATGRWSAVAEEALWYENHQIQPVFGVPLRGDLAQLLTVARFSQDIGSWENYEGPEFLQIPVTCIQGES